MAKRFTTRFVENARRDPTKRIEIPDAGKPGLYLVIQPSGKKSWAVRYRYHGRPRKVTLEGFPSLGVAHKLAQAELDKVAEGRDPASEKRATKKVLPAERDSDLFGSVLEQFVRRHVDKNTKPSSAVETKRLLGVRVDKETGKLVGVPGGLAEKWGKRRIQEIQKRDVLALLDAIEDRGGGLSANRTLAAVRKLFNWAVGRGIKGLDASPVSGVKPPLEERSRDRVLNDDEIRWFWNACDQLGYPFGPFAKMLLLTGQRRSEIAGMSRSEIKNGAWIIPGERTKNGEPHEVPLSDAALAIIESVPHIKTDKGYVFTTRADKHVKGYSAAKRAIDKAMIAAAAGEGRKSHVAIPRWTFHDLRRTAATGMQRLGIELPVVEKALNHLSGSFAGIVGVYQRDELAEEKIDALDAWARYVELIRNKDLWPTHNALIETQDKDKRKEARKRFRAAIQQGGELWQRYLKSLKSARTSKDNVVSMMA